LKRGRITIPKEARRKIEDKRCEFYRFLITRDRSVKIIKFEFVWNKA
jgi:bifunctional DNA-binding transcriptional regulator/antitoxin component of YhaV-PrlF toxin-antitoxin module